MGRMDTLPFMSFHQQEESLVLCHSFYSVTNFCSGCKANDWGKRKRASQNPFHVTRTERGRHKGLNPV
eukprot:12486616-Ditylum_brightwellii.AAC.1